MGQELILRDHRALQQALVRTTLVGAGAGLLQLIHPGALAAGLGILAVPVAAVLPRSLRQAAIAAILVLSGAAAATVGGPVAVVGVGLSGALLYALESRGTARRLVAAGLGGAALFGGLFVGEGLHVGLDGLLAPALAWLVSFGAAGFIGGFGVIGREVDLVPSLPAAPGGESLADLVGVVASERALAAGAGDTGVTGAAGELAELLGRARAACEKVHQMLGDEVPGAAAAASDLLRKIGVFSSRWRETEGQLGASDRPALVERIERIAERAQAASDEVVRGEYLRAERALRQQLADLDAIRGWQDRAIARLHHHVAVLERLRLAALHRRSAESGRSGDELAPLVEELSAASFDLDGAAEILAELPG